MLEFTPEPRDEKHGVLVCIRLSDDDLGTAADDELVDAIDTAVRMAVERKPNVGYWDGHEFGDGWAVVFCYGKDAVALSERVVEALLPFDLDRTVQVVSETELIPDTLDSLIMLNVTAGGVHQH